MREIGVMMHLSIHKIAFHVKFPATLSLQMELDRKITSIVQGISLGNQIIQAQKQVAFQFTLNYDEHTNAYENKKANILICIKTKTSQNKLTAGVVPIQLKGPDQYIANTVAKPLRCNDSKAFIEYSLRTEALPNETLIPEKSISARTTGMLQEKKSIFKSAVHYNNNYVDNEDPEKEHSSSKNELNKYLNVPMGKDQRKRYKSSGKLPLHNGKNLEEEDSRTEVISYRKEQLPHDYSIASSRHTIEQRQARELSRRSEVLSKEVSEARLIQENLKAQNKELRCKASKYEQEIDEKQAQIAHLHKRIEIRQSSSAEQLKQLRTKLAEVDTQLHQLLLEKNQYLNQMELKQKETAAILKQREKTISEGKRKHLLELQLKIQQNESLLNDKIELTDSLKHSQKMMTDLIVEMQAKQKQCQNLRKQLQVLRLEMLDKTNTLQGLQTQIVDKERAVGDLKAQKKLIYEIKHQRDQKDIALTQSNATISELNQILTQKGEELRQKQSILNRLVNENQDLKSQLKQQTLKERELQARIKDYEVQLKRSADKSSKFGKQIKQVETELKGIKKQASSEVCQKNKLIEGYLEMMASLQEKIVILQEEKILKQRQMARLNNSLRLKEDECYDLGQQLIISKEDATNLANNIQLIREQNIYLAKTVQQLTEKEQKLLRAEERLQYNEKLYEQLEQKYELQRIQLQGQIRGLQDRNEQKSQALRNLSDRFRRSQREQLQLQDQIETLKIGLVNRTNQLNFLKMQIDRNRDNSIQFQQRMTILRRTQENATSTLEELREDNENLSRVVKENSQAIVSLGKRYDSLYRSTSQTITQFLELIRSEKSIINSSLRHQKVQISTLINDCIRHIALQRENKAALIQKISKALEEQSAANKENMKIIRLKAQIQKELQDEMQVMKAYQQSLQSNIGKLQRDIENHLYTIKQGENTIADLNSDMIVLRKNHMNQLAKKDQAIQKGGKEIDRLNYQIQLDAQKYNTNIEKVKLAMANLEAELQAKISALNQNIIEIKGELKQQRDDSKQQRLKINEIQSFNSKLSKQKQEIISDLEKRTNQLIASRLQSQNRNKLLIEKQSQIMIMQKTMEKLTNDNSSLAQKMLKCEQFSKQLSIKRAECQTTLKEKKNEILVLKLRIQEMEEAKGKLMQQRQDLIKNKGVQQTLISTLNQSIKSLRDASIVNEDKMKKLMYEKDCSEKENNKKLNMINNEKAVLERQIGELRAKMTQKQADFAIKQRALQEQIKSSKVKINEHSTLIADLKKQIIQSNTKMNNLLSDFNAKTAQIQSKQKSLLPNAGKLKEVLQSINELKSIGKQYETSKSKLLRLANTTKLEEVDYERICEVARELGMTINKMKIQVLNKLSLSTQMKTTLLQALKGLQMVTQKLHRH